MSDANPFEEQPVVEATITESYNPEQGPPGPEPIPTSLMIISIVGLLFGLFGLLGICLSGGSLAMSEMIVDFLPNEDAKAATRELLDLQFIPHHHSNRHFVDCIAVRRYNQRNADLNDGGV